MADGVTKNRPTTSGATSRAGLLTIFAGAVMLALGVTGVLAAPVAGAAQSRSAQPGTARPGPAQPGTARPGSELLPRPAAAAGWWAPWRPAFPVPRWQPGVPGDLWPPVGEPAAVPTAPGGWKVQRTVNPAVRNGALAAGSCTNLSACTAVGGYVDRAGAGVPLAERWNGRNWTIQAAPDPARAIWSRLFGVSCTAADSCAAVGYFFNRAQHVLPLVERWNGGRWRIQAARVPAGSIDAGFFAVSCTSARACTAAGARTGSAGKTVALAERWNGATWRIQATASPAGSVGSEFLAVACSSPRVCTAGGSYGNSAGQGVILAERWAGRHWRIQATVSPAGSAGSGFSGLSCASARLCIAVGSYGTADGGSVQLAERWNGTRWRRQATPSPAGSTLSELLAVSCTAARSCTAVGSYVGTARKGVPLAQRWNGTRWRLQAVPGPARSVGSGLAAVSCTSARACVAAGSFDTRGALLTLADRWDGASWQATVTPSPAGAGDGELAAVSCASARACMAVGSSSGISAPGRTLAERWDGARWRLKVTPHPAGAVSAGFADVSCTSARACTAVGTYRKGGKDAPLAVRWNGMTWRLQVMPAPADGGADLFGVSCSAATDCAAVGTYRVSGMDLPLAERWNGRSWRIQATPHPAGVGQLFGVSCSSPSSCVAVSGEFAEVWNGTSWRVQATAQLPPGSQGVTLSGVSCQSASFCTAVGSYFGKNGGPLTLAEVWNGTAWQKVTTPNRHGAQRNELTGVSCTSARACTATGDSAANDFSPPVALAEVWDGTRWSLQTTPNPAGTVSSVLLGVSCPTATSCTAVGYRFGLSGRLLTFAVSSG